MEILRLRCRRAASLGLTYRQYTSVLLDRGVHLQAIIFEFGGTLVQMKNGEAQPLPGVLEKLGQLTAPRIFVITGDPQAPSMITQLNKYCDDCITDHGIYGDASDAKRTIADLLAKYKLSPAAAVMIGDSDTDYKSAQAAKLAKFIRAGDYFG